MAYGRHNAVGRLGVSDGAQHHLVGGAGAVAHEGGVGGGWHHGVGGGGDHCPGYHGCFRGRHEGGVAPD